MSNLGGYQFLTTLSKKADGPGKLVALIAGTGAAAGGLAVKDGEIAIKKGKEAIANNKGKNYKLYEEVQVKYIIKQD